MKTETTRPKAVSRAAAVLVAALAFGWSGCSEPALRGYQVQGVPEGFVYSANVDAGESIFPNREMLGRGAWFGDVQAFEPRSEISITRYQGAATAEEAQAARDRQAARYGNPTSIDYGLVVPFTIDERNAFTWLETRYDERGAVRSIDYTVVIPYDTLTYALEFSTSAPARLHADSVTRVLHSWGEG